MIKKTAYKMLIFVTLVVIILQYSLIQTVYAVPETNTTQSTEATNTSQSTEEIDPDQNYTNEDDDNLRDEVDDDTGTMLNPLIEIVRAIEDAIISILTKCMLGSKGNERVMVKWDELDTSNIAIANSTKTFSEDEIAQFKDSKGNMLDLKYPNLKYTPEEIFKGEIDIFSIDFIGGKSIKDGKSVENSSEGWNSLRETVSSWYKVLRYIAMIGLLSVLIYLGIRIIFSSSAGKKADYKSSLINWVFAIGMLFFMHYIMAFIISIIQHLTSLLGNSIGNIKVIFGADKVFVTNFMGLARFQAQQYSLINQIIYIVIYLMFITLTFKFTFIYFKRMLTMAMLTIVSPLIALMYPLDKKGSGKSKVFDFWVKEYTYNALLQPMHLLLYDILIGSAVQISVNNPVYTVVALYFLAEAEKIFKKIFGFGRARGGTVGGLASAVGSAAVVSSFMKQAKGIRQSLSQPNTLNGNSNVGDKTDELSDFDEEERQDEAFEKKYGKIHRNSNPLNIDRNIFNKRKELTNKDFKNVQERLKGFDQSFNQLKTNGLVKGKNGGFNGTTKKALNELQSTINGNERLFSDANIPLQYNDKFSKLTSNQLLERMKKSLKEGNLDEAQEYYDILRRRMLENQYIRTHGGPKAFIKGELSDLTDEALRERYNKAKADGDKKEILACEAEMELRANNYTKYNEKNEELKKLNKNSIKPNSPVAQQENKEIEIEEKIISQEENNIQEEKNNSNTNKQGENHIQNPFSKLFRKSPNKTIRNMNENNSRLSRTARRTISGVGNVVHEAVKPVWDTDESIKKNMFNLGGKAAKKVVQTTIGVTATAIQAGVSMTDGRYSAKEAMASFATGMAAGKKIVNSGEKFIKGVKRDIDYSGTEEERKDRIAKEWTERDDVNKYYKDVYGRNANKMINLAQNYLVKEGIKDTTEQQKVIRYANYLMRNHKLDSEEKCYKQAAKVFKFRNKNDDIPYGEKERKEYIAKKVEEDGSSKSRNSVEKKYTDLLNQVDELESVEDNQEYNLL